MLTPLLDSALATLPIGAERVSTTDVLDAVGIDAICACIEAGHSFSTIAHHLGFDRSMLRRWVASCPQRTARFNESRKESCEALYEKGERALETATSLFELARANALAGHLRKWAALRNPERAGGTAMPPAKPLRPATVYQLTDQELYAIAAGGRPKP